MYKKNAITKTSLKVNTSTEGEALESKLERILTNNEPIKDGAPIIHSERSQGVLAGTNVRTDRFEVAVDTMDKVTMDKYAKRENLLKIVKEDKKEDGKTEPIQGENAQ